MTPFEVRFRGGTGLDEMYFHSQTRYDVYNNVVYPTGGAAVVFEDAGYGDPNETAHFLGLAGGRDGRLPRSADQRARTCPRPRRVRPPPLGRRRQRRRLARRPLEWNGRRGRRAAGLLHGTTWATTSPSRRSASGDTARTPPTPSGSPPPFDRPHIGFTGNGGHDELLLENITTATVNNGWVSPAGGKDIWFNSNDLDVIRVYGTNGDNTGPRQRPDAVPDVQFVGYGGWDHLRLNNVSSAGANNGWVTVAGGRDVWFDWPSVEVVGIGGTGGNDTVSIFASLPNTHIGFDGYGGTNDVLRVGVGEAWIYNGVFVRPGDRDIWFEAYGVEVVEAHGGAGNDILHIPWGIAVRPRLVHRQRRVRPVADVQPPRGVAEQRVDHPARQQGRLVQPVHDGAGRAARDEPRRTTSTSPRR